MRGTSSKLDRIQGLTAAQAIEVTPAQR